MLQKKIEKAASWLRKHPAIIACPKCQQTFTLEGYSLTCQKGHTFNLSKKGTLYFLEKKIESDYTKEMLQHRQKMIQSGLYQPMLDEIAALLQKDKVTEVLDVGCGEGSFLARLAEMQVPGAKIGFDISKEGVELATAHQADALWLVADLTKLPIQTASISHLLNIFSPSHYHEFDRVLKPNGKVIKVIPGANYLKELRLRLMEGTAKEDYSNEKVYQRFKEEMEIISEKNITYTFPLPSERQLDFLSMSPLSWQATADQRAALLADPIETITIDVKVLEGITKK